MCLALMGPGDTAIVPAPYFPVHMYAVALASGNVIALEVADSEKFLSNIAYTCQHLYPRPKLLIINYPHNPSSVTVEPEFFVDVVKLAKRYGFMVISDFAYADVAFDGYEPPSFLRRTRRDRRGRRVHDDEQGLQHGRLASRLLLRQCRDDPRRWESSRVTTTTACFRRSRSPRSWPCETPRPPSKQQSLLYQSRRDVLVRGAASNRLGCRTAPRRDVRLGADSRDLATADEHDGLRHDVAGAGRRRRQSRQRLWRRRAKALCGWRWSRTKTGLRQAVRQIGRCLDREAKRRGMDQPAGRPSGDSAVPTVHP